VKFHHDWKAFRRAAGETRPWAIVAHSMGALVARSYVEDPEAYANDVSSLVLIAPVNQGSSLAKAQAFLQLLQSVQAVQRKQTTDALSGLADGLGEAANDISPGSPFLTSLNKRPRRAGIPYHILAGDTGLVNQATRKQLEGKIDLIRKQSGFLGGLTRLATGDLSARLDEVSDGTGDGCVSLERTRLKGAPDPVIIHANHAELIRAPLLFSDPGPVVCMPYLLKWLSPKPAADPHENRVP
jgi:pimeloyl-ACP methyl ester carboxylesterase